MSDRERCVGSGRRRPRRFTRRHWYPPFSDILARQLAARSRSETGAGTAGRGANRRGKLAPSAQRFCHIGDRPGGGAVGRRRHTRAHAAPAVIPATRSGYSQRIGHSDGALAWHARKPRADTRGLERRPGAWPRRAGSAVGGDGGYRPDARRQQPAGLLDHCGCAAGE